MDFTQQRFQVQNGNFYDSDSQSTDLHRSNVIEGAEFRLMDAPLCITDLEEFHRIFEKIQKRAALYDSIKEIENPEIKILGPKKTKKWLETKHPGYLLTNHLSPTTFLICCSDETLEDTDDYSEPMDLPFNNLMLHFEQGQPPKLIKRTQDSHVALVEDTYRPEYINRDSPEAYYQRKTGCSRSRLLTETEKMYVKQRDGWNKKQARREIRLLEFKSVDERNAAEERGFNFLDTIHSNAVFLGEAMFKEGEYVVEVLEQTEKIKDIPKWLRNIIKDVATEKGLLSRYQLEQEKFSRDSCKYKNQPDRYRIKFHSATMAKKLEKGFRRKLKEDGFIEPNGTIDAIYRETWPIHRSVRRVYEDLFVKTRIELGRVSMFSEVRWQHGDELGLIVMEGFCTEDVHREAEKLKEAMLPIEFDCSGLYMQLLHGIGEAFVRSEASRLQCLVDVDKKASKLSILGSARAKLIEAVERFCSIKKNIEVMIDIPMSYPFFNGPGLLQDEEVYSIGKSLGAHCYLEDDSLKFIGTVEAYELLVSKLKDISQCIFDNVRKTLSLDVSSCPACLCDIEDRDFVKLECGHMLCRDCANNQVDSIILDRSEDRKIMKLECAVERCDYQWTPQELLLIILGDNRRNMSLDAKKLLPFCKAAKEYVCRTDIINLRCCGAPDCDGILIWRPQNPSEPCSNPDCTYRYCGDCFEATHEGQACEEDRERAAILDSFEGEYQIKRCPNCRTRVQKSIGCNHMTCKCGQHFCWLCLAKVKGGADCNRHLLEVHERIGDVDPYYEQNGEPVDLGVQAALFENPRQFR